MPRIGLVSFSRKRGTDKAATTKGLPVTGSSFLEARGEGFLNLVRDSLRLSGRRPELEQIGAATKLTIFTQS